MDLFHKVLLGSLLTATWGVAQTNAVMPADVPVSVAPGTTTVAQPLDTIPAQESISSGPDTVFVTVADTIKHMDTIYIASATSSKIEVTNTDSVRYGAKQSMMFGVHAGVGSVQFISDKNNNDLTGLSWNVGLIASFPLNDYTASLEINTLLNYRLVNRVYNVNEESCKNRIEQYTIDIPFFLKYGSINSRFQFLFGPQLSVSIYDNLEIFSDGRTVVDEDLLDASAREPIDWALVTGLGIMANSHVIFDFRFIVGISEMYSNLYRNGEYWSFTPIGIHMGVNLVF